MPELPIFVVETVFDDQKTAGLFAPPGSLQAHREVAICWASCLHFCLLFCLLFGEGVGVGVEMFLLSESKHIEIPILSRKVSTPTPTTPQRLQNSFVNSFVNSFLDLGPARARPAWPPGRPSSLRC